MTFTSPFTAVTGAVITAAGWNTSGRDNLSHLRAILPDPGAANKVLVSTSASAAAFALLLPDNMDSVDSPADDEVLTYDSGTGQFEWQAVSGLLTSVPSGMGAWVPTAAAIPSGFTRYSSLDGRIPVGAGTTFSVTFTENTNYGSSWQHDHTIGHTHTYSGTTGASQGGTGYDEDEAGNGHNTRDQDHNHQFSGTTSDSNNPNTGGASWVIPSRAVVFITKD